jgi:hypothetical protein
MQLFYCVDGYDSGESGFGGFQEIVRRIAHSRKNDDRTAVGKFANDSRDMLDALGICDG